jgi:hypothetical protein
MKTEQDLKHLQVEADLSRKDDTSHLTIERLEFQISQLSEQLLEIKKNHNITLDELQQYHDRLLH